MYELGFSFFLVCLCWYIQLCDQREGIYQQLVSVKICIALEYFIALINNFIQTLNFSWSDNLLNQHHAFKETEKPHLVSLLTTYSARMFWWTGKAPKSQQHNGNYVHLIHLLMENKESIQRGIQNFRYWFASYM